MKENNIIIVEKDFSVAGFSKQDYSSSVSGKRVTQKKFVADSVDDTIEMALKFGDDETFVDNGKSEEYGRIALITH